MVFVEISDAASINVDDIRSFEKLDDSYTRVTYTNGNSENFRISIEEFKSNITSAIVAHFQLMKGQFNG